MSADDERLPRMRELRAAGMTWKAIGDEYGLSDERVRQLVTTHGGDPKPKKSKK
jgi:orotate phosphoribosyltransferase-like protein